LYCEKKFKKKGGETDENGQMARMRKKRGKKAAKGVSDFPRGTKTNEAQAEQGQKGIMLFYEFLFKGKV